MNKANPPVMILLDIDGVLNDHKYYKDHSPDAWHQPIQPEPCKHLETVCRRFDVQFVIISSWRESILRKHQSYKAWEWMLHTHGVHGQVIGATGGLDSNGRTINGHDERGQQVQAFLDWKKNYRSAYIVIDDHPVTGFADRQVQPRMGMTEQDAQKAIVMLGLML